MSRNRFAVPLLLLVLAALAVPASAQVVDLGHISTVSCAVICYGNDCSGSGPIDSVTINPPFYVRGIRRTNIANDACANPALANRVNLPLTLQPGQALFVDIDLVATDVGNFSRDLFINGGAALPYFATVNPAPPCPPSAPDVLCLNNDRFTVRSYWRTATNTRGPGTKVQGIPSDDSGLFFFFNQNNWEMLIKVLNGCGVNNHYWVFFAATTNVGFTVTVTDTEEQEAKVYFNPLLSPADAVTDTSAFATCP